MNIALFAARSTFRNKRRSIITLITVAIGTLALCLFGGFVNTVYQGIETGIVRTSGQIHLYREGFFEYGAGRATDYDIADYQRIVDTLQGDDRLAKRIAVITPTLSIGGIAGNYAENSSQTFVGVGLNPADHARMRMWNDYGTSGESSAFPLPADAQGGFIGTGLAKILNLCDELNIAGCTDAPTPVPDNTGAIDPEIADLQLEVDASAQALPRFPATIDLLGAAASGAPNIIRLPVLSAQAQAQKAVDDRFVAMPLPMAQQLVYGQDEQRVTTLIIQLHHTTDMEDTVAHLRTLIDAQAWPLEVKGFTDFNVTYSRITAMFSTIFGFISVVIAIVVVFTIVNNLSMSVMERFNEIGTLRSIGSRRSVIREQFVLEGIILGVLGAALGLSLGMIVETLVNLSGFSWTPPSNTIPQPLMLNLYANPIMPLGIGLGMIIVTALSSLPPANRAARMPIVDALRHH